MSVQNDVDNVGKSVDETGGDTDPFEFVGRPIHQIQPHLKVLVVEDDWEQFPIVRSALGKFGSLCEMSWVQSAEEAFALINAPNKANVEAPYNLMILDIILGGRINGAQLLRHIQLSKLNISVVITTALPPEDLKEMFRTNDIPPILRKPYTVSDCKEVIQRMLM